MFKISSKYQGFIWSLAAFNLLGVFLLVVRMIGLGEVRYWFVPYNLFLAWLPVFFMCFLVRRLKVKPWKNWMNLLLTFLFVAFLPNSFYVVTDYTHLYATDEVTKVYDIVMLFVFTVSSYFAGYMGVYLFHQELLKRKRPIVVNRLLASLFVSCGVALYIGRVLRWNSWDLVLNTRELTTDVVNTVFSSQGLAEMLIITAVFSLLIGGLYAVVYQIIAFVSAPNR